MGSEENARTKGTAGTPGSENVTLVVQFDKLTQVVKRMATELEQIKCRLDSISDYLVGSNSSVSTLSMRHRTSTMEQSDFDDYESTMEEMLDAMRGELDASHLS